jgi:hypothetical protein
MGIFRGKRKKGLRLSIYRKPLTYASKNEKPMTIALHAFSSPSYSPDCKKSRWLSPSPRHFESFHNVLLSTTTISPLTSSNTKRKLDWYDNSKEINDSYKDIKEHFCLLDISEEDEIETYNNNHDSVDGISKPLDALEYEIQIDEIEKLIPDILKVLAEDEHETLVRVLAEDDHGTLVKDIFQLLYEKKFPLKNIAFRLWADVVQWFTLKDTTM